MNAICGAPKIVSGRRVINLKKDWSKKHRGAGNTDHRKDNWLRYRRKVPLVQRIAVEQVRIIDRGSDRQRPCTETKNPHLTDGKKKRLGTHIHEGRFY